MRRGRLLLPWGLLAGLLIWTAAIEGLSIKAPSLLKKPRNVTTNVTTTTSTTSIPASASDLTAAAQEELEEQDEPESSPEGGVNVTEKSHLTGNPQEDYKYDPNLPRELPPGYNLSSYPFFSRVPNDVDFVCGEELLDGYYANVKYKCQVYHHCLSGIRYDFLCANYTAFDQKTFICHFVSEVDCVNSAKFWNRNKGLYETPTTTTIAPLTTTAAPARRPAPAPAAGGRRRRPYRRRRPAYEYYYDDEYDEEYEDDVTAPGQSQAGRNKRPDASVAPTTAAVEAGGDEKPFKADSSIYNRQRQPPKIRRPVPVNERDKYEYTPKESGDKKTGKDDYDRPAERDYDRKRPQESLDYDKPRSQEPSQSRARPKPRPVLDDDEYYDDDDYELPRTTSRKNNQDYYAPSGGDRDFSRRPAMTGQGRPLRRNRPGARRRPVDDDYYDDRRPYRSSSEEEPRRRPSARDEEPRRRPSVRDEEPRRRPSQRDEDPPRRRPATSDEEPRRRPAASSEEEPRSERRRPAKIEDDRRASSSEEDVRRRPVDDEPRRRPAVQEEEVRRRPTKIFDEEDSRRRPTSSPRKRIPPRDDYERESSTEKEKPTRLHSSRDSVYDRPTGRDAGIEKPLTTGRDSSFDRPREKIQSSRDVDRSTERTRPSRVKDDVAPTGSGSTHVRPLSSRTQPSKDSDESDEPIPAAKPAYISTTGRAAYRKRVQDEEVYRGAVRNAQPLEEEVRVPPTGGASFRTRTSPVAKSTTEHIELPPPTASSYRPTSRTTTAAPVTAKKTEPPPVYEDEYYDDEEEEGVEELPTGPGRTQVQPLPSVAPIKKPVSRAREEVYDDVEEARGKSGRVQYEEDRRASPTSETRVHVEKESNAEVDGTGRVISSQERVLARPIVEQKRPPPSSSYHFNGDDVLVETSTRVPFRPRSAAATTTTTSTTPTPFTEEIIERHNYQNNYRRKSNQASNIESTKVLPSNEELRDIEEVRQPSSTHPTTESPPPKTTAHTLRLETDKFEVRKTLPDAFPATGKSTIHYTKHVGVRFPDEFPRRAVLPDITDPEYDVTLNEAVHPTRLPHNDGTTRIKIKVPVYQYGTSLDPTGAGHLKKSATLLSSASQTHIAKTPFPVHDKPLREEEYDDEPLEDEYEDTEIPTGKGATKPMYQETQLPSEKGRYEWSTTPSVLRTSVITVPNRPSTGHYIVQSSVPRQQGFPAAGRFEQQPVLTAVRSNGQQQQFYKPREPAVYHGGLNPLAFSVGYDYDYRPQRKYVRRGAYDYFGKPY